jgi:transporter family-2 protein
MWGILIAILSGIAMSIQGVFNTGITKQTGTWLVAAWVQLTGFLVCFLLWAFLERPEVSIGELFTVQHKYMLLGGVLGAFITWSVIYAMAELGPAKAVLLIVIAQILMAYIIQLFGWFLTERTPFYCQIIIGILVAIAGLVIFKWE